MGHLSNSSRAFFITGTDTEVGKTFFSQALIHALNAKELKTAAYKPIAAGCGVGPEGLRNEDALALQAASSIELSYAEVNPIALAQPIAPHLAAEIAQQQGQTIDMSLAHIKQGFCHLVAKQADAVIVEGAGGWRLPLGADNEGQQRYLSDFVANQNLAVIMVVGMRLGCLNHAILTADSIRQHGLKLVGWVANKLAPSMPYVDENIASLAKLLAAPLIAELPMLDSPLDAVSYLDLGRLGY